MILSAPTPSDTGASESHPEILTVTEEPSPETSTAAYTEPDWLQTVPATELPATAPAYTSIDLGYWGKINEDAMDYWVRIQCQNWGADFSGSEQQYLHQKRSFSKSLFT